MTTNNQVQLITYPDSLGGDLSSLKKALEKYFPNSFKGGLHILPPFPSSGDRGFAPITYLEIDSEFGSWNDIKELGEKYDIMVDLMVNHISKESKYFQDFLDKGLNSEYADMFITLNKFWPDGKPLEEDIDKIFLRRKKPFSAYQLRNGDNITVWTTFGNTDPSEQIDLDISSEKTQEALKNILQNFSDNNVSHVRLDAVGYIIKKRGTSCFFVEPEIYKYLNELKDTAEKVGIELLPEVHAEKNIQFELSNQKFWIYDFILPFLVLSTLINQSSKQLKKYLVDRPRNQYTMLDCHDGIPVLPDLEGMIDYNEAKGVTDLCIERGANISHIISNNPNKDPKFDVHQINGTYYSMLGENDDAYILARAIQFFTPGIPQIYYVGLLAGTNNLYSKQAEEDGRDINRKNYSMDEIAKNSEREVVQRLIKLIEFRNSFSVFDGQFEVKESEDNDIKLFWKKGEKYCVLYADLNKNICSIEYGKIEGQKNIYYP